MMIKDPFASLFRNSEKKVLRVLSGLLKTQVTSLEQLAPPDGDPDLLFSAPRFLEKDAVGLQKLLWKPAANVRRYPFNEAVSAEGDFVLVFDGTSEMGSAGSLWLLRYTARPEKVLEAFRGRKEGVVVSLPVRDGYEILAIQAVALK